MRRFLFIIWALLSIEAFAQRSQIDSLSSLLDQSTKQDSLHAQLLIDLSYAYHQTNPDTALQLATQAEKLCQTLELEQTRAWALNRMAVSHWMQGRYPDALRLTQEALEIFEKHNVLEGLGQSYNSIANVYNMENENQKAIPYYKKSIDIYKQLKDDFHVARANANLGRTYYLIGEYSQALVHLQRVLTSQQDNPNTILYAIVLNTMGDVYQELDKMEEAESLYLRGLEISTDLGVPRIVTYSTRGLAEVYQYQGDLQKSNEFAKRTLDISKETGYIENVKNASLILADNYETMNDFRLAYSYYQEYTAAKDSMYSADKEKEIRKLRENFELKQQQKEIKLLEAEKALQEQENYRQKSWVYILLSFAVLISGLVFVQYRKNRLKQRTNKLLTEQRNRLAEQNIEISKQREEIKQQADEIIENSKAKDKIFSIISHDLKSPFNSLLTITEHLDAEMFTREQLTIMKNKLHSQVKSLSEMLNNLLFWAKTQLQQSDADHEPFDPEEIVNKNIELFKILAEKKDIKMSQNLQLSSQALADKNHMDCVIRNLLNNALKFTSQGGQVIIGGKETNDEIILYVQDNGVGIPKDIVDKLFTADADIRTTGTAEEKGSGIGLFLSKEFVTKNNGKIWVESEEGKGSSFFISMPKYPGGSYFSISFRSSNIHGSNSDTVG